MKNYLFLLAAIIFEVLGTSFLNKTEQFTKLVPSVIFFGAFFMSFLMLSYALKGIPLGIAYAIWSAVGIVLTHLIHHIYWFYK